MAMAWIIPKVAVIFVLEPQPPGAVSGVSQPSLISQGHHRIEP
jgi:hypothetical protein